MVFQPSFICFANNYIQTCKVFSLYLESLTTNKYIVKDSFKFTTEIVDQDFSNFMGSLDIDSLFTNITLKETIKI